MKIIPENSNDSFQQLGFFVMEKFLSDTEVGQINSELSRLKKDVLPKMPASEVYYDQKGDSNSLKQLQRLQVYDTFFNTLMINSPFQKIAEHLLGEPVEGKNLQYFNKRPLVSQPTPPHQDGYYFMIKPLKAVTLWLALDHVDEGNGCLRYLPKSHLHGLRPHSRTETLGFSQGITGYGTESDMADEMPLCCAPGTLIGHHANTIHRADQNYSRNRDRRALGFIYYAASVIEDETRNNNYQASLVKDLQEDNLI
ncbi:MAG: phytanoyl-CoA dioxygenase family protein [Candidatus Marinimicrobia bacterium]|jgi:phytanoyl-CoA hydroxylase|nr:phytanoyl-CoA dioxygenase family protein [Candidatus Neomarinimicrobiota bacterium]